MIQKIVKLKRDRIGEKVFLILTLGIILFFYHGWFMPGTLFGSDFQVRPVEFFSFFLSPHSWMSSLYGGHNTSGLSNSISPVYIFAGIVSTFTDYSLLQKIVWLYPFLLTSYISFYFLIKKFIKNKYAIYTSALFFVVNPIVLERLTNGHVWFSMVYAMFPLLVYLLIITLKNEKFLNYAILLGLVFSISGWFDLRMTALALIPLIIYLIYYITTEKSWKSVLKVTQVFSIVFGITILLNLHQLGFLILYPGQLYDTSLLASTTALEGTSKYAGTLLQTFQLSPKSWSDFYTPISIVIPILAFSTLLTKYRKNRLIILSALSALFMIFLGKGSEEPFGDFYVWVLQNVPYTVAFRNPSKFWYVLAFLYSFLIAFWLQATIDRLSRFRFRYRSLATYLILFFILIVIVSSVSFFIHGYFNYYKTDEEQKEWKPFSRYLSMFQPYSEEHIDLLYDTWGYIQENSTRYSRTLWLPTTHFFRFASEDNPILYPSLFSQPRLPYNQFFLIGHNGVVVSKNIDYDLGDILGLARIEHVVLPLPHHPNWLISKTSLVNFENKIFGNQENLEVISKSGTIPLDKDKLSIKGGTGKLNFETDHITFSNDGRSSLVYEISELDDSISFRIKESTPENIGITFRDQSNNTLNYPIKTEDTWTTYTISTDEHADEINWDDLKSIEFDGVYGGYLLYIGDLEIQDSHKIYKVKNVVPLIYSADKHLLSTNTMSDAIQISRSETETLHKYAIIDINSASDTVQELFSQVQEHDSDKTFVSWDKLSPSKYVVDVESVSPIVLIFTETYDKNWSVYLDGQKIPADFHFLVNGYANGFYIDKIGTFSLTIEHEPQKWLSIGLPIVLVAFLCLVLYLILVWCKKRKAGHFFKSKIASLVNPNRDP